MLGTMERVQTSSGAVVRIARLLLMHFPEYCALLKKYGPMDIFKRLAAVWASDHPERYEDWLAFYVGADPAARIREGQGDASVYQEAREQAAVFYHVAHDVALRLLILEQDPDEVEAMFKKPMPPAEQLMCRCGLKLELT